MRLIRSVARKRCTRDLPTFLRHLVVRSYNPLALVLRSTFSDIGMPSMAKVLGIRPQRLTKLVDEYGIDFPR